MPSKKRSERDAQMAADTATVLFHRLPMLFALNVLGDQRHAKEADRMVTEKTTALVEGMVASQMEVFHHMSLAPIRLMTGATPADLAQKMVNDVTDAAIAPANKTLKANAKRLSKD